MAGVHRRAVDRTIRAGNGVLGDRDAALVELCRTLADQMDVPGADGPSTRLSAAYLSALKDLRRVMEPVKVKPRGESRLDVLRATERGR
jgi:hypothetical protein